MTPAERALREAFGQRPFRGSEARDVGVSAAALRTACLNGAVTRLSRGIYAVDRAQPATASDLGQLSRVDAGELKVLAEAALVSLGPVRAAIAGRVAGRMRDLPFIAPSGARDDHGGIEIMVHEKDAQRLGRLVTGAILRPVRELPPDISEVAGLPVTGVLHTAIDVARMGTRSTKGRRARALPIPEALVPLDAATARLGASTTAEAIELIQALRPRFRYGPGIRTVDAAAEFVDPRAESPLESWSRGYMIVYGVPRPPTQVDVAGSDGRTYRVDFCWPDARVIVEVDGLEKYGSTPAEVRAAKRAELARQRALEAAGWIVVRWGWDELARDPRALMMALAVTLRAGPLEPSCLPFRRANRPKNRSYSK